MRITKILWGMAWAVMVLSCAGLLASFAGAIHPAGDALAVFRLPLAITSLLSVLAVVRPYWVAIVLAAILALGIGLHLNRYRPASEPVESDVTIYQKNLWRIALEQNTFMADLTKTAPDVVTLQEIDGRNKDVARALKSDFPHQALCNPNASNSAAVLSRLAFLPDSKICGDGFAAVQVQSKQGPLWVISLHLEWPWPFTQSEHISAIIDQLRAMRGPKVIGGDFNTVAWAYAMKRIEKATNTNRIGPYLKTYAVAGLGYKIGIDHILVSAPGHGTVHRKGPLGSDHRGLFAHIDLP